MTNQETTAKLRAVMDAMPSGEGLYDADKMQARTPGLKFDDGKRDYTLLPWDALEDIVKVLEFGAKKYARDNWRNVEADRYVKAAFRHLVAYNNGEIYDPETGLPHMAHLGCCVLFLLSLENPE